MLTLCRDTSFACNFFDSQDDLIIKKSSINKTILLYFQSKIIFRDNLALILSRYLLRKNIPGISRPLQKPLMLP
jgi:hypothetical protein